MKNESEEHCDVSRKGQILDSKIKNLSCANDEPGNFQMLAESISAMSLWKTNQDSSSNDSNEPQSNSACANTNTGALPAECCAGAAVLTDTEHFEVMQEIKWRRYCEAELSTRSTSELQTLLQQLRFKIEEVSGELVVLLQDRQRLREEVPIRNVTIAQLLKVHEQLQLNFPEPLAIQMSVIFPDHNEALDCL